MVAIYVRYRILAVCAIEGRLAVTLGPRVHLPNCRDPYDDGELCRPALESSRLGPRNRYGAGPREYETDYPTPPPAPTYPWFR